MMQYDWNPRVQLRETAPDKVNLVFSHPGDSSQAPLSWPLARRWKLKLTRLMPRKSSYISDTENWCIELRRLIEAHISALEVGRLDVYEMQEDAGVYLTARGQVHAAD